MRPNSILIMSKVSLISSGTERMLLEFGRAGWFDKMHQQPEKVRKVLDKIRTDGLMPTIDAVRAKLDQPMPLGYCNVGVVMEAESSKLKAESSKLKAESNKEGEQQGREGKPFINSKFKIQHSSFQTGDRVVSNGPHAEVVCVPENLCARVPDNVSDDEAVFAVVGAIGLQGIRLAQPTLGECFVVIGLGLIGLLTVQILKAHGCRVLGIDVDPWRCGLARGFGAEAVDLSKGEDPVAQALAFSRGRGVDGVLITAATKSNEPVHQAALMCRKRGRIILVGVSGLTLWRDDFYKKELSFQVSCSYGPGRYDPEYEEKGQDYPVGFVRWTAQRNFEAVLDLMAAGKLDVKPLITHRFRFEEAEKAYELIAQHKEPSVGIILQYRDYSGLKAQGPRLKGKEDFKTRKNDRTIKLKLRHELSAISHELPVVGIIGAGNFTGQVLLPALKKTGVRLKTIASSGGVSGTHLGKKFGFEESTTDAERIFANPEINTVFITTRHNTHARFVLEAFKAGKNVFVEKPLCISQTELEKVLSFRFYDLSRDKDDSESSNLKPKSSNLNPVLMVGFNRRFAPQVQKMKELLDGAREPKSMIMTVNAGKIPPDHWIQDPEVGGGRIIGEACHFIDLLRFLAGSEIVECDKKIMQGGLGDTLSINLTFEDGSIGTVHYFANGSKRFPKERLEVFSGGKILQLDNFRVLRGFGWKRFKTMRLWRQDKGHGAEVKAFVEAVSNGGPSPIPFEEIVEVTKVSLDLGFKF